MASGAKMSYNHFQSGKYGGLPQSSPQKDIEVSQDMHLKMSKKIAQLTKVIYALNTKNDENESVIQTLRDQHEEEIQQILADTRQKIAIYKDRLDAESDQQATIQALQMRVAEHQADHSAIWEQFSQYKEEVAARQEREKQDYAAKLFDMSHDLLKAKKDFEEHMERFGSWKERITAEHTTAFSELKSKHESELEDLRSFQRNQDDTWLNQCAKIEEKFKDQIDNLKTQVEGMQLEKVRLNEEYTIKLEKAQAFYEKELEALKHSKSQEHKNESEALRKEIDRLKSDFGANDRDMRVQIDRLVHQLADTEDALELSKKQQLELQAELSGRDSSSGELLKQLQDLKEQMASQGASLHSVEAELAASKQHCTDLADELMKKSTLLGQLEAHNMQKDGVIGSLRSELEALKEKMMHIDAERTSLLSQNQSMSTEQKSQLLSLRKALEDMTVEKETQKQRYERNIQSLTEELARTEKELKEEMAKKVAELEKNHADARDQDRKLAAGVLSSTKQGLMEKHESELGQEKLKQESIQAELEALRANLTDQLAAAQAEIKRLEKVVKDSEEGYGTASGQLNNLKELATQLRAELEKTRSELKASKTAAANLQAEIEKAKVLHESKLAQVETEMQNRLHSLTEELDTKWKETMKVESGKLRQELTAQKEDEKRAALSQLSKLKDEEIAAVRAGLDAQFDCLRKQLEELQLRLEQAQSATDAERVKRETDIEQEKSNLQKCMLEAANDNSNKIAAMEKMHAQEIERLVAHKDQEKLDLEGELQKRHLEEMKGQMAAHKAAMDNASQLELRQRQAALEELKKTQLEEMKKLQAEFEERKQLDIEELKQNHAAEIRAARMELDRAVEISRQKEKDHHMQLEDLRTEIGHRDQHIKNLQDQLLKLQNEIDKLKQEIQAKLLEIKQVQKQAGQQLKLQEDKLNRHNQQAMDNLTADHLRDQQDMLSQFGSAQEMLKDKISGLQIELQESQMKYEQRESRPEDLEMIESLRCEVSERENRIKDLIDEKRFYQLELVNRETNFNKVFNTTPNVGVLNPFAKPKKKGDKGPNLSMNGGNHQRLDPLPGSPMHDGKLNPSKPLPQPNFTKKFVK